MLTCLLINAGTSRRRHVLFFIVRRCVAMVWRGRWQPATAAATAAAAARYVSLVGDEERLGHLSDLTDLYYIYTAIVERTASMHGWRRYRPQIISTTHV